MAALDAPGLGVLYVLGRLRDGGTSSSAVSELAAIMQSDAAAHGFRNVEIPKPVLTPLRDYVSDNGRPVLIALAATCVAILLIACMNVSSLLLMRVSSSRRMFAIRTALGATRARIAGEELVVAVVLSAAGTIVGVILSWLGVRVLRALAPPGVPLLGTVHIDGRAIVCAAAACLGAVLASGLIPALRAARATSNDVLTGRSTAGVSTTRQRNVLVALQVAAALVLLLLAGVSIQSARHIRAIDLGFAPRHLATLNASIPDATATQQRQFSRDLLAAIRAIRGVTDASAVSLRPLQGRIGNDMSFLLEGQRPFPSLDAQNNPIVVEEVIAPRFFRTMGASIVRGRDFTEDDNGDRASVVIVSDDLARMLWRDQNPIGRRLQLSDAPVDASGTPRWSTVVGIVADIRYRSVTDQRPDLYVPYSQTPESVPHVMIRTAGPLTSLIPDVRAAARRLHPHATVDGADTMEAVVKRATAPWNLNMWLFSVLGSTGLLLAVIGLYGLLAYLVSENRRELGVRLALGATPRHLAWRIVAQALRLTVFGLMIGLAAATVFSRFARNIAYEVRPLDTAPVALVCLILLAVAAAASYVPARRATAIDPATVLRME
jgi:putative ABC transport system permease protein